MNRTVFTIILSGTLILVTGLLFYFVPITIFPCTLTAAGNITTDSVCSLGYIYEPQEYVVAKLTPYGQALLFVITGVMPIAVAILIVFRRGNAAEALNNENAARANQFKNYQ